MLGLPHSLPPHPRVDSLSMSSDCYACAWMHRRAVVCGTAGSVRSRHRHRAAVAASRRVLSSGHGRHSTSNPPARYAPCLIGARWCRLFHCSLFVLATLRCVVDRLPPLMRTCATSAVFEDHQPSPIKNGVEHRPAHTVDHPGDVRVRAASRGRVRTQLSTPLSARPCAGVVVLRHIRCG